MNLAQGVYQTPRINRISVLQTVSPAGVEPAGRKSGPDLQSGRPTTCPTTTKVSDLVGGQGIEPCGVGFRRPVRHQARPNSTAKKSLGAPVISRWPIGSDHRRCPFGAKVRPSADYPVPCSPPSMNLIAALIDGPGNQRRHPSWSTAEEKTASGSSPIPLTSRRTRPTNGPTPRGPLAPPA